MKNKKRPSKKITPVSAATAVLALAAYGAHAQLTPVFSATFPSSWSGTGTTVTDQSTAGNTGFQSGTATYSTTAVPPGATGGTGSMVLGGAGGIKVTPTKLLANASIAADGGFTYNIDFLWNGTATPATQKLVDYAGTESLQLTSLTANTSATLGMAFGGDTGTAPDADVVSTTILPNTWYDVTMTFNTEGNSLGGTGDISGIADLYVNGILVSSAAATKGTYGDSLNRPIAIGELAYGHTTSILGLTGDIYSASVDLGVAPVPEPSSMALGLVGGFGVLGTMWKARRRKS
jgi:PEP-CTERM motif